MKNIVLIFMFLNLTACMSEPTQLNTASTNTKNKEATMTAYIKHAKILKHDTGISIYFYIDDTGKLGKILNALEQINEEAYMNGDGWNGLLNHYLPINHPDVLDGLESDPEGSMYSGHYREISTKTEKKAEKFAEIIDDLINHEHKIYDFVKVEGSNIEWD